mmetsp:Transcript_6370/g.17114  ORF Transcript_6370/g.17114 Transcript_6370/m.17114 type:complete len:279 (+) Transcript_6370:90-926(+)
MRVSSIWASRSACRESSLASATSAKRSCSARRLPASSSACVRCGACSSSMASGSRSAGTTAGAWLGLVASIAIGASGTAGTGSPSGRRSELPKKLMAPGEAGGSRPSTAMAAKAAGAAGAVAIGSSCGTAIGFIGLCPLLASTMTVGLTCRAACEGGEVESAALNQEGATLRAAALAPSATREKMRLAWVDASFRFIVENIDVPAAGSVGMSCIEDFAPEDVWLAMAASTSGGGADAARGCCRTACTAAAVSAETTGLKEGVAAAPESSKKSGVTPLE